MGETSPLHFISHSHFAVWQSPLWSFGVGNYVPSHCLISSDPGRKQQSIEPSCIPLSTLCTHRWTASDNAINSTCSETVLPQETGNHPYRKKLSCTRRSLELGETAEGKIVQGDLPKCSHFTYPSTVHRTFHVSLSWPTAGLQSLAEGLIPPVSCSDWMSRLLVVLSSSSPIWNLRGLT